MLITVDAIKKSICEDIRVVEDAAGEKFSVYTPFMFDDGDHCSLRVESYEGRLRISDGGDTVFRSAYDGADITGKGYDDRFHNLLDFYSVNYNEGVLFTDADSVNGLGDKVFEVLQTIFEVMSLAKLPKKKPKSADNFDEAFNDKLTSVISDSELRSDWSDPDLDPHRLYRADYSVVAGSLNWLLFGVPTAYRSLHAALTSQHYKHHSDNFRSLAVLGTKRIPASHLGPLSDVSDHVLSLEDDKKKIEDILQTEILLKK